MELLSRLSLFADYSKLFSRIITNENRLKVNNIDGGRLLQDGVDRVVVWAKKWKMEFNVEKCKIMHLGKNNLKRSYNMGDTNLQTTEKERSGGTDRLSTRFWEAY